MEQLNKKKKYKAIFEVIIALIIGAILFPIGLIFAIIQPIFFYNGKRNLILYFWNFIYQIYTVIMYWLHHLALTIDILGNVIAGDFIELFVTKERDTLFANKKHTISQAMGYLEANNLLTPFGNRIKLFIDKIFGKDHCIDAYKNM